MSKVKRTALKHTSPNRRPNTPKDDKNIEKLINELRNLSNGITEHEQKLIQRKNEYTRLFGQTQKLKKPLQKVKKELETLKDLTQQFKYSMIEKDLLAEDCKGFTELTKKIDVALESINDKESERVKNKYGLEKSYTGQYLTISKNNSKRGVTCNSANAEINNTINNLKAGKISIEDAKKVKTKYDNLLTTSKNGLDKLNKEILKQIDVSNSNGSSTDSTITSLVKQYEKYRTQLIQSTEKLENFVEKGNEKLKEIKKLSPSDGSAISKLESWIKSLSLSDALHIINPAVSACVGFVVTAGLKYLTE